MWLWGEFGVTVPQYMLEQDYTNFPGTSYVIHSEHTPMSNQVAETTPRLTTVLPTV